MNLMAYGYYYISSESKIMCMGLKLKKNKDKAEQHTVSMTVMTSCVGADSLRDILEPHLHLTNRSHRDPGHRPHYTAALHNEWSARVKTAATLPLTGSDWAFQLNLTPKDLQVNRKRGQRQHTSSQPQ
ncbi:unnamed protein product [Tetraodon nigroviridis]|uniref:(spotted green pufferfish) hypothetical protein n=1 Tax=Tetraodon nigroviridis TaxID=99883 RepID=Q4T4G3_TETNG|nr:unnamed protein product [Tetraodon nigroviridis]